MKKVAASTTLPRPPAKRRQTVLPIPFRAFIAYADIAAAGGVMTAMNEVFRAAPRKYTLRPMLWRFDQLLSPQWRDGALGDAATAEIVVFASTPAMPFPLALEEWTAEVLKRRRAQSTTFVSLLGPGDTWTVTLEQPRDAGLPGRPPYPFEARFVA